MTVYYVCDEESHIIDVCPTFEEARYSAAEEQAADIYEQTMEEEEIKGKRKVVYRYYFIKECNFVKGKWIFEMVLLGSCYCFADEGTKYYCNEERGDIIIDLEERDDEKACRVLQEKTHFF